MRFEEWLHANSVKWATADARPGPRPREASRGRQGRLARRTGQVGGAGVPLADRQFDSAVRGAVAARLRQGPEEEMAARHRPARPRLVADRGEVHRRHAQPRRQPRRIWDYVQLEVYGRGNNAYRWAGETDVCGGRRIAAHDSAGRSSRSTRTGSCCAASRWVGLGRGTSGCTTRPSSA